MYDHQITLEVACVPFVKLHQLIKYEVRNSESFGTCREADEEQCCCGCDLELELPVVS